MTKTNVTSWDGQIFSKLKKCTFFSQKAVGFQVMKLLLGTAVINDCVKLVHQTELLVNAHASFCTPTYFCGTEDITIKTNQTRH